MDRIIAVVHYLPIFTTLISAAFAYVILSRYRSKPQAKHLLWWGIGVAIYGAGTLVESLTTLFGWHVVFFKAWYIVGALLGGAPLALGTVYLLMGKRAGDIAAVTLVWIVGVTSTFVVLSPIRTELIDPAILNSKVLEWQTIRIVSPFVNGLAALFLIGGAFYSAGQYFRRPEMRNRFIGNLLIAVGAILPGVGGMMSRMGHTEGLYVGELIGIILIWYGYRYCQKPAVRREPAREPALSKS
jgi:hypothetical protein